MLFSIHSFDTDAVPIFHLYTMAFMRAGFFNYLEFALFPVAAVIRQFQ